MFFLVLSPLSYISCNKLYRDIYKCNIYISPCINKTSYFGLETKLTNRIINEILNDGRLTLVNNKKQAEYILLIHINKYIIKKIRWKNDDDNIYSYYPYSSMPVYKVSTVLSLTITDKNNNVIFYKPNLQSIYICTSNETYSINTTFDRLATNIIKQVVHFVNFI